MGMEEGKVFICGLLGVAFAASVFVIWLILFRLRDHLVSKSYRAILVGKICFAVLTGSGIYLILWPLPVRVLWIQLTWFSILALGTIHSAAGFYLYSRDVQSVLQSESYTESLPAVPPPNGIHKSHPPEEV